MLARCATEFAALILEFEFSGAQITSYLLQYRGSPASTLDNASKWVTRILRERVEKHKKVPSGASSGSEPAACPEVPAEGDEEGLRGRSLGRSKPGLRRSKKSHDLVSSIWQANTLSKLLPTRHTR